MIKEKSVIDGYEMTADQFKRSFVINYNDITPLGKTMLDGADFVRARDGYINVYKSNTLVYTFGYNYYGENDWYGREGLELVG